MTGSHPPPGLVLGMGQEQGRVLKLHHCTVSQHAPQARSEGGGAPCKSELQSITQGMVHHPLTL